MALLKPQQSTNAGSLTKAAALLISVLCLANTGNASLLNNKKGSPSLASYHAGSPAVLPE